MRRMADPVAVMQDSHARGDVPRFVEADLEFYRILLEAVDNPFLEALVQPLAAVVRELREETSSDPETREHAIDYHGRILAMVDERDTVGAREAMRDQLTLTEQHVERFRSEPEGPPSLGPAR